MLAVGSFVVGKGGDGPPHTLDWIEQEPFTELNCKSFCVRNEPMKPDCPSKLFVGEDLTTVRLLPLLKRGPWLFCAAV